MQLAAGAFATAGLRGADRMEDRHVISEALQGLSETWLLAVFDGHRGAEAAQYAAEHIVDTVQQQLHSNSPTHALSNSFVSLDTAFRSVTRHPNDSSASLVTVAMKKAVVAVNSSFKRPADLGL